MIAAHQKPAAYIEFNTPRMVYSVIIPVLTKSEEMIKRPNEHEANHAIVILKYKQENFNGGPRGQNLPGTI